MKKLYRIKVETQYVVLAEDKKEAKDLAQDVIKAELIERPQGLAILGPLTMGSFVPNGWLDRLPYSLFKRLPRHLVNKTIRQIFNNRLLDPHIRRSKNANHQPAGTQGAEEEEKEEQNQTP